MNSEQTVAVMRALADGVACRGHCDQPVPVRMTMIPGVLMEHWQPNGWGSWTEAMAGCAPSLAFHTLKARIEREGHIVEPVVLGTDGLVRDGIQRVVAAAILGMYVPVVY